MTNISISLVTQIVNAARMSELENQVITSPKVAVIDVKRDSERDTNDAKKSPGIVVFTLPEIDRQNKNLQDCKVATAAEDKDNTLLLVSNSNSVECVFRKVQLKYFFARNQTQFFKHNFNFIYFTIYHTHINKISKGN